MGHFVVGLLVLASAQLLTISDWHQFLLILIGLGLIVYGAITYNQEK